MYYVYCKPRRFKRGRTGRNWATKVNPICPYFDLPLLAFPSWSFIGHAPTFVATFRERGGGLGWLGSRGRSEEGEGVRARTYMA